MTSLASSLLDLKAELGKKRAESKQTRITSDCGNAKRNFIKQDNKEKIEKRSQTPASANIEEEQQLKKSRSMLEAKAKMYDGILSEEISLDESEEDTCLVNFSEKRKQVMKRHLNTICHDSSVSKHVELATNRPVICVSDEQKIGKESVDSVHYQNVQFNEIRDHGVGYFAFSETEAERQQQMKILGNIRQQAEKRVNLHLERTEKKKKALDSRLSKICRRRNIDENVLEKDTSESQSHESLPVAPAVETIPLPCDLAVCENKKVRPWDIGKMPDHFRIKNGDGEKEKPSRDEEFAPPKSYFSSSFQRKESLGKTSFHT